MELVGPKDVQQGTKDLTVRIVSIYIYIFFPTLFYCVAWESRGYLVESQLTKDQY